MIAANTTVGMLVTTNSEGRYIVSTQKARGKDGLGAEDEFLRAVPNAGAGHTASPFPSTSESPPYKTCLAGTFGYTLAPDALGQDAKAAADLGQDALLKQCLEAALQGEAALPWNHCRLMMLGGGCVGKTSCINALSGAPFQQKCDSTVGAKVQTLQLERKEMIATKGQAFVEYALGLRIQHRRCCPSCYSCCGFEGFGG